MYNTRGKADPGDPGDLRTPGKYRIHDNTMRVTFIHLYVYLPEAYLNKIHGPLTYANSSRPI